MREYSDIFPNEHAILPVIHAESLDQVRRNVDVVYEAGCDGFFLINMPEGGLDYERLLEIHDRVVEERPGGWSGVNCLDLYPAGLFREAVEHPLVRGIWVDHAGISPNGSVTDAAIIRKSRQESKFPGLYFGGVAFKYREQVEDLSSVARAAVEFVDVVTTSGDKTGQPPTLEKIMTIRQAIGERKNLAIASGISAENVGPFLPYADRFLVASSLLRPGTEDFDPGLVRDLVKAVRQSK